MSLNDRVEVYFRVEGKFQEKGKYGKFQTGASCKVKNNECFQQMRSIQSWMEHASKARLQTIYLTSQLHTVHLKSGYEWNAGPNYA